MRGTITMGKTRNRKVSVPIGSNFPIIDSHPKEQKYDTIEDLIEEKQQQQEEYEHLLEEEKDMDGGWGWMVVLASFLCNVILDGICYSFGVMLEPMREDFQASSGSIALVGSILAGVYMLVGPIAAASINRFGARLTCMAGSVISAGAIFCSSYASCIPTLIASYGVCGGFGLGLMYVPAVVTVGQYFNKRLSLATGICVCGSGAGTFIFAPLAAQLVSALGWRGCNRVMAGLCLLCCLFGLVLVPRKSAATTTSQSADRSSSSSNFNFAILRDSAFLLVALGNFPIIMSIYATYAYIPKMAVSLGMSSSQASYLISSIGVTNTLGRILCGWLTDLPSVSPIIVTVIAAFLGGIFPVFFPLCVTYRSFLSSAAVFGFIISALPTVSSAILVDLLGKENLNSAFGILTFVRGAAALTGPPLAGFILDMTGSYPSAFALSTVGLFLAAALHAIVWVMKHKKEAWKHQYTPI